MSAYALYNVHETLQLNCAVSLLKCVAVGKMLRRLVMGWNLRIRSLGARD